MPTMHVHVHVWGVGYQSELHGWGLQVSVNTMWLHWVQSGKLSQGGWHVGVALQ
jgi:hypothetical protein